ncbi:MAG: DedA family protein [Herpetosiphonaceae bacterium]|nr:DedA family protein [Herpetosiphonaceae bacterium]
MLHFTTQELTALLGTYGYWAVLLLVGIESIGVPVPGETMLVAAAIYAGTSHKLSIGLIIAAAATGAILGDNIGYWIGHAGGYRLLRRYGKYIRLDERKLKVGRYLFQQHGSKVVFFGRFIALLRTLAAFLAGTNRMPWPEFLLANAGGGIVWSLLFGLGGYLLGDNVKRVEGPFRWLAAILAIIFTAGLIIFLRSNEARLEAAAEAAFPGPLDSYQAAS